MTRWAAICLLVALTACTGTGASPTTTAAGGPSTTVAADPSTTFSTGTSSSPVVLTDAGCTTSAIDPLSLGIFAVRVRNDSSSTANFELLHLEVTYDEFASFYAEAHQKLQAGGRSGASAAGAPQDTTLQQVMYLEPGSSAALREELTAGTYAVLCETIELGGDTPTDFAYTGFSRSVPTSWSTRPWLRRFGRERVPLGRPT